MARKTKVREHIRKGDVAVKQHNREIANKKASKGSSRSPMDDKTEDKNKIKSNKNKILRIVIDDDDEGGMQSAVQIGTPKENIEDYDFRDGDYMDFQVWRLNKEYEENHPKEDFSQDIVDYQTFVILKDLIDIDYSIDAGGLKQLYPDSEDYKIQLNIGLEEELSNFLDKNNIIIDKDGLKIFLQKEIDRLRKVIEQDIGDREFFEKYEEQLENPYIDEIAKDNNMSGEQFKTILYQNFKTGGRAYQSILEDYLEDYEDEESPIYSAVKSMITAHYRHTKTDYDLIDKSGLSDDEVKELRRSYN